MGKIMSEARKLDQEEVKKKKVFTSNEPYGKG